MEYDVFISHASEDKADVARPLAMHLQGLGLKVWLDELELTLGDSLRRKIDQGLSRSRYGLVILSPGFFSKEWPNKELDGLVAREDGRAKVILPVWHNVSSADIIKFSPTLAVKLAVSTSLGLAHVADRVFDAVRREKAQVLDPIEVVRQSEAQVLEQLRKRMIISDSSWQLRETFYELEAYLAKYPHSPQARMLKNTMHAALLRAEAMERPVPRKRGTVEGAPPALSTPLRILSLAFLVGLVVLVLVILVGILW
jgi:hypothetical protein